MRFRGVVSAGDPARRTRGEPTIRVLIIDDHRLFAEAIGASLRAHGFEVAGIALTGEEGCAIAQVVQPDVVLVDIDLPDRSGLDVGLSIRDSSPRTRIVALTALTDRRLFAEASKLEFDGYVSKYAPIETFVEAVRAASNGNAVFTHHGTSRRESENDEVLLVNQLTKREREILALLAKGLDGESIARQLTISVHTVRTHVHSILTKLQVHSRLEAATLALRTGLVGEGGRRPHGMISTA